VGAGFRPSPGDAAGISDVVITTRRLGVVRVSRQTSVDKRAMLRVMILRTRLRSVIGTSCQLAARKARCALRVMARSASWERGRRGVPGGAAPLGCFPPAMSAVRREKGFRRGLR
jgi:hypothetical protein